MEWITDYKDFIEKPIYEVGEYIGWFKVLEVIKQGNRGRIYTVQCMKCGKILPRKEKRTIKKYLKNNNCNKHRNKIDGALKVGDIVKNKYRVIRECGRSDKGGHYYDFQCIDCGFIKTHTIPMHLKTKTCNHYGTGKRYYWSNQRIKSMYYAMRERCYNKKCKAYADYGGRGIKICREWHDPERPYECRQAFDQWAQANGYQEDLEINRKDVNGDYCPENCEFVTKAYNNSHDRRDIVLVEVDGEINKVSDWSVLLWGKKGYLFGWLHKHGKYENIIGLKELIHNRMVETGFYIATLWVDQTYMSYESWDINCMYPPGTIYKYMLECGEVEASIFVYNRLESLGLKNVVGFTE